MTQPLAKKVLLIGWDAADWKIANPLLDAGLMPTLDGMISEGVMGNIATLQPILSPMLWNSIATGKRPHKHGIHGFMEPDPHSGGIRPVSSTSRKVKALWNILTQRGYKTHVLGMVCGASRGADQRSVGFRSLSARECAAGQTVGSANWGGASGKIARYIRAAAHASW